MGKKRTHNEFSSSVRDVCECNSNKENHEGTIDFELYNNKKKQVTERDNHQFHHGRFSPEEIGSEPEIIFLTIISID